MYTAQASETAAALRERIEGLEETITEMNYRAFEREQVVTHQASIIADLRAALAERDVRLARLGRIGECHQ